MHLIYGRIPLNTDFDYSNKKESELLHKYTRTPLHVGKILERKQFNYDSGIDFQFRFKS